MTGIRRAAAILLALVPLLYAAAALFWGWVAWAMQCDEICDPDSTNWRYTHDAWQWYAIGGLAVVAAISGIAFFLAVVRRRAIPALVWLLIGTAAVVTDIAKLWVNPGSDEELVLQPIFYVVSAAVFAAGVAAAALVRRPRGRTG